MKVFRNTIILVLVFVVLIGVYYVSKLNKKQESKRIFDFTYTQIKGISLYKSNVDVFDLNKNNDVWTITKPFTFDTEIKAVNSTLKSVSNLSYLLTIDSKDTKSYGFDKPLYQIIIKLDDKNVKLLIGDKTPTDSNYYVKTDKSDVIYKVDGATIDNIMPIGDYIYSYIDKDIIGTSFDKFTYLINGKEYTLTQKSGKWYFNGNQLIDSDVDQIKSDISEVTVSDIDSSLNKNKSVSYSMLITKNGVTKRVDFITRDSSTMTIWINGQNFGMYLDNDKVNDLVNELYSLASNS